jgi:hypothetical protein
MPNDTSLPPEVPGVTEGIPQPDPMKMIAAMLGPGQMTGMQHIMEALTHLKSASRADPRLQSKIAEAIRALMQPEECYRSTESLRGGQPELGPMPGGYLQIRGPR